MRNKALMLLVTVFGACATPDVSTHRSSIIGGEQEHQRTAVVGLAASLSGVFFSGHCTGTLIAPNLVLTARHCVALTQDPGGEVICGETGFTLTGPASLFRATTETVRPSEDGPSFYVGGGDLPFVDPAAVDICGGDVALLMLQGDGIPSSEATPIAPRLDQPAVVGERFTTVGYGLTEPGGEKKHTRMRLEDNEVLCGGGGCVGALVKPGEFGSDARICLGDSGGPALDGEGRVFGVVSRALYDCTSSVYSDISAHRELIVRAAVAAAASGGYPLPEWARAQLADAQVADAGSEAGVDAGTDAALLEGDKDAMSTSVTDASASDASSSGGCAVALSEAVPSLPLPLVLLLLVLFGRREHPKGRRTTRTGRS